MLEKFYTKERQLTPSGNNNRLDFSTEYIHHYSPFIRETKEHPPVFSEDLGEDLRQAVLKQLEEERAEKVWIFIPSQLHILLQDKLAQ